MNFKVKGLKLFVHRGASVVLYDQGEREKKGKEVKGERNKKREKKKGIEAFFSNLTSLFA